MSTNPVVSVIVLDREIRDLICLNLRFESFNTIPVSSIEEFISSHADTSLIVLDICGNTNPQKTISSIQESTSNEVPIILLTDRSTPKTDALHEFLIEYHNGRKRFDASELVMTVKEIIESRIDRPLQHPLTGLPAGSVVEKHIAGLLAGSTKFTFIASDMDNMKAFNQRFGYSVGDTLLTKLVDLMKNVLKEYSDDLNFIGHRGEDDFVIITQPEDAIAIAENIVDRFDIMVEDFFNEEDLDRGYFIVTDRRGNEIQFPLTTISLVIINTDGRWFLHPAELYDVAEELMAKVKARGIDKSYCAVDKREKPNTAKDVFI